jgi:hypothetical protein
MYLAAEDSRSVRGEAPHDAGPCGDLQALEQTTAWQAAFCALIPPR